MPPRRGFKKTAFRSKTAGLRSRQALARDTRVSMGRETFTRRPTGRGRAYGPLYRTGGFTGIELKFLDLGLISAAIASPTDAAGGEDDPTGDTLNAIAQGDGESNRDGRRCVLKSVYVTGVVTNGFDANSADMDSGHNIFIALVLDTQTNGAQLNSEDVFTNPGADASSCTNVLRNLQFTSRFRVLDSTVVIPPLRPSGTDGTNTVSIAGYTIPWKLSSNLDLPVNHTGTTANVSTIQDNSLHIISYIAPNNTTGAVLTYNSRVRFVG